MSTALGVRFASSKLSRVPERIFIHVFSRCKDNKYQVADESGGDFVLTGVVGTSEVGTETFVVAEGSTEVNGGLIGLSLTLDVDIGDDGEIDCSSDFTVAAPGSLNAPGGVLKGS